MAHHPPVLLFHHRPVGDTIQKNLELHQFFVTRVRTLADTYASLADTYPTLMFGLDDQSAVLVNEIARMGRAPMRRIAVLDLPHASEKYIRDQLRKLHVDAAFEPGKGQWDAVPSWMHEFMDLGPMRPIETAKRGRGVVLDVHDCRDRFIFLGKENTLRER